MISGSPLVRARNDAVLDRPVINPNQKFLAGQEER